MLAANGQPLLVACSVTVDMAPDGAFDLFAHRTAAWWPIGRDPNMHSRRKIILEPHANGRFYETNANGDEKLWGNVVAYVRPRTLVINWRLDAEFAANDGAATDLEIFFAGGVDGSSRVTIIHSALDRLGGHAATVRGVVNHRWDNILSSFRAFTRCEPGRAERLPDIRFRGPRMRAGLY